MTHAPSPRPAPDGGSVHAFAPRPALPHGRFPGSVR